MHTTQVEPPVCTGEPWNDMSEFPKNTQNTTYFRPFSWQKRRFSPPLLLIIFLSKDTRKDFLRKIKISDCLKRRWRGLGVYGTSTAKSARNKCSLNTNSLLFEPRGCPRPDSRECLVYSSLKLEWYNVRDCSDMKHYLNSRRSPWTSGSDEQRYLRV